MDVIQKKPRRWMLILCSLFFLLQCMEWFPIASYYRLQNHYFYKRVSEQKNQYDGGIRIIGCRILPVFGFAGENPVTELTKEEQNMLEHILQEEALEGMEVVTSQFVEESNADQTVNDQGGNETARLQMGEQQSVDASEGQLEQNLQQEMAQEVTEGVEQENELAQKENKTVPIQMDSEKIQQFTKKDFTDYQELLKRFYTVDRTTEPTEEQISYENLLHRNLALAHKNQEGEAPQILIYHTHSQEQFADSIPGDMATGVVGAGEYLTQILRDTYGYQVMHHLGTYDIDGRAHAYSNAEPAIEDLLKDNPDIEVIIDLHRDAVAEESKLVTNINGQPTAKFMFFNGLSYTKELGKITYLNNPYMNENLAFAFQMEITAESYYPGITRKIYLKGYRYNMHFAGRSLLIELGAQTNTMQEIWNAIPPIAATLDRVLSGTEPAIPE